jgi:cation:H+ antiporter
MNTIGQFMTLIVGLALLWSGTSLVLNGATNIARHYRVSELLIGVTILAIGSDLPELVVSVDSAFKILQGFDTSGLIVGNAIGSATGQIALVLGIAGLASYLTLTERLVFVHGSMLLISVIALFLAGDDGLVSRADGAAMILIFVIYMVMAFKSEARAEPAAVTVEHPTWRYWAYTLAGIVVVLVGSEVTIDSALGLAESLGVRQSLVGIVLLGLGSSLPELGISLRAAIRKQGGLSVGNLIGSNIFDALVPVGAAATISAVEFSKSLARFDLPFLFGVSLVVLMLFRRKRGLQKPEALLLIGIYVAYLILKLMRF